jgi:hypothetical protein
MQKVYIGEQNVDTSRDTRCFHADEDDLNTCTDTQVSPNGIKFQLELNQQNGYPHGSSDFWNDCENDGGTDETCATCFLVEIDVDLGDLSLNLTWHTPMSTTWILEDKAKGLQYDFKYSFERVYNRNNNKMDFAKGVTVTLLQATKGSIFMCAPKKDFDLTQYGAVFLYDPEVTVGRFLSKCVILVITFFPCWLFLLFFSFSHFLLFLSLPMSGSLGSFTRVTGQLGDTSSSDSFDYFGTKGKSMSAGGASSAGDEEASTRSTLAEKAQANMLTIWIVSGGLCLSLLFAAMGNLCDLYRKKQQVHAVAELIELLTPIEEVRRSTFKDV